MNKSSIDLPKVLDSEVSMARISDWILEPREPWTESQRFQLLIGVLESSSERAARVSDAIAKIFEENEAFSLFVRVGIPSEPTLVSEAQERLVRNFLPHPHLGHDLADAFRRVFRWRATREWVEHIPFESMVRGICLIGQDAPGSERVRVAARKVLRDSILYLSGKIRSLGLERDLYDSVYLELDSVCQRLVEEDLSKDEGLREFRSVLERARFALKSRITDLDQRGAPRAHVVYQIERLNGSLERIALLVNCLFSTAEISGPREAIHWVALFRALVTGAERDQSAMGIITQVLRVPFDAILEHSAKVGELNIARLPRQQRAIFYSTLGGGLVTCLMLLIKYMIPEHSLSLFWGAFLEALNYSACFLLMQVVGFSLASKKPAMTGVTLSKQLPGEGECRSEFFRKAWAAFKTQTYAVIGNVVGVGVAAILAAIAYRHLLGREFLSTEAAEKMIADLHPTRSLTLFYAVLTGVLLWVASINSGCFARWSMHRKINHGFLRPKTMGGIGMNVGLGVLLAFVPMIGKFFGIPVEVRHITLSAGALAMASATLGVTRSLEIGLVPALYGLLCIAFLNFSVSFYLAWYTDQRARRSFQPKFANGARERLQQALAPIPTLTPSRRTV